eukprot:874138-Pleurochrysis_carterae.AAC.1
MQGMRGRGSETERKVGIGRGKEGEAGRYDKRARNRHRSSRQSERVCCACTCFGGRVDLTCAHSL